MKKENSDKLFICGYGSMVEYELPKLRTRVRFPLSAVKEIGR